MNASTTTSVNSTETPDTSFCQDPLDPSNQSIPDAGSDGSSNFAIPSRYSNSLSEEQQRLRLARCYRLLSALAKRKGAEQLRGQEAMDPAPSEQNTVGLDNATQE